jgi:hypothetical protein
MFRQLKGEKFLSGGDETAEFQPGAPVTGLSCIQYNNLFPNYRRNEDEAKYLFLNYRRNEGEAKYSFLNYRRNEDEAKYSFLNYR